MALAVAIDKRDLPFAYLANHNPVAGFPEWRRHVAKLHVLYFAGQHITQPRPANQSRQSLLHLSVSINTVLTPI